jgi:hypothetical protein
MLLLTAAMLYPKKNELLVREEKQVPQAQCSFHMAYTKNMTCLRLEEFHRLPSPKTLIPKLKIRKFVMRR